MCHIGTIHAQKIQRRLALEFFLESVMKIATQIAAALAAAVMVAAAPAAAVNVVANGDFEAGNVGFSSGYTFQIPGQYGNPGTALDAGLYAIDTNANNTHLAWVNLADHTSGSGRYLIANGAGTNTPLWQQTVNVLPGFTYNFSAWVADVCCLVGGVANSLNGVSPPAFVFTVTDGQNSTNVANFSFPAFNAGVWQKFNGNFANVTATSLLLTITNLNQTAAGNDLGLDDISFNAVGGVPETATWIMMITGFGMVGFARRRQVRTVAA